MCYSTYYNDRRSSIGCSFSDIMSFIYEFEDMGLQPDSGYFSPRGMSTDDRFNFREDISIEDAETLTNSKFSDIEPKFELQLDESQIFKRRHFRSWDDNSSPQTSSRQNYSHSVPLGFSDESEKFEIDFAEYLSETLMLIITTSTKIFSCQKLKLKFC